MKYYIGIDGGGTKSDCIITDEKYLILNTVRGGALNLLTLGLDESVKIINQIINTCLTSTGIKLSQIAGIGIGTAGAGQREDASELEKSLTGLYTEEINISVVSDAEAGLEGAFNGKPGCILISGTGSIIYGKDDEGIIHRCGGYGRIIGDQGSGYSIGKKGLIAVIRQFDHTGKHTAITRLLNERFRINSFKEIIRAVYKECLDIASVTPLVIEAAELNDTAAREIVDEETNSLLELISCMVKKLRKNEVDIVFTGGLISSVNCFSDILRKKISDSYKYITIRQSEYPPAMGAVFILNKNKRGVI